MKASTDWIAEDKSAALVLKRAFSAVAETIISQSPSSQLKHLKSPFKAIRVTDQQLKSIKAVINFSINQVFNN